MTEFTPESTRNSAERRVENTTCYMCACRCGIRVTLEGDKVRYIEGNPDHPLNKGVICAKGASGIMKQESPARLTRPLKRKQGSERGAGEFEAIEWSEAMDMLSERLKKIRATDPKKFALFTGRDQMQALTGLFAKQYGTPNYAAHGGFCSVNMAAGMIYSIGGSFWEFGGPDLEQAKLFVMVGTAEDHHSNPLKTAISKFKRNGGKFISINPVRTGYSAIADEWVPIRPGTDGALLMAWNKLIIDQGFADNEFLQDFSNAADLVNTDSSSDQHGLFFRDGEKQAQWLNKNGEVVGRYGCDAPQLEAEAAVDGVSAKTAFTLLREQLAHCTPEWASDITGVPVETIERIAQEMGVVAKHQRFELPIKWTDTRGREHQSVTGVPVAFHAMRGLAAHSNGFQTIRALSTLMTLLGTIDRPGGFRHKAPFPKPIPPAPKTPKCPEDIQPNTPLAGVPLGFPASPDDLLLDDNGEAVRIDKAFSWEHPLSLHGMMHNVITNASRKDPYGIDTLLIFMANMAWNSTMNTSEVRDMLNAKDEQGEYVIPFLVVCDAFQSEMVAFADLVLPDTTYLERHDVMSMLDRPISEFNGPVDSVRVPLLPPKGQCRPFQDVLIELAGRLELPAFSDDQGQAKYENYADFVVKFETAPGSGVGFLSGWRGANGDQPMVGEPHPDQWKRYKENNCVHHYELPESMQYMRNWNQDYLQWAKESHLIHDTSAIDIHLYSEILQQFRLAGEGKRPGRQPPDELRERITTYFDPLPFYYPPLESQVQGNAGYPIKAVTQRPMAMYHSWDSQNAWLRQIHTYNYLYLNSQLGREIGAEDGGFVWVESMWGKVRCLCRFSEAVEPGTVWTWNAIGKSKGAWQLDPDANESRQGFLLNHLISEELPAGTSSARAVSNSDPVTGQAAWYDVQVKISADSTMPGMDDTRSWPQFDAMPAPPGVAESVPDSIAYNVSKSTLKEGA